MQTRTFCLFIFLIIASLVINIGTITTIIYHFDTEEKNSKTQVLSNGEDNSIFEDIISEIN